MDIERTVAGIVIGVATYQIAVRFGTLCGVAFLLVTTSVYKAIFD